MKKTLILLFLLIPTMVQAKVSLCEKGCTPMDTIQINAIKGFLYEVANAQEPSIKKQILTKFARCLVWLDAIHKDTKNHIVTKYSTEDASLVKASVQFIIDVAMGRHSEMSPEATIARWTENGARIIVQYKEIKTKDKYGKQKIKIQWKLELPTK